MLKEWQCGRWPGSVEVWKMTWRFLRPGATDSVMLCQFLTSSQTIFIALLFVVKISGRGIQGLSIDWVSLCNQKSLNLGLVLETEEQIMFCFKFRNISWKENPQDEISDYLISYLPTKRSEKLCLQWNDFQDNIISAFRNLREDNDFEDKYDLAMCCIWWLCLASKPAT